MCQVSLLRAPKLNKVDCEIDRPRSNMDDCIPEIMLICMHVPNITFAGPIVTEKLTFTVKTTVLSSSLGKTFFAWRFILNEKNLF